MTEDRKICRNCNYWNPRLDKPNDPNNINCYYGCQNPRINYSYRDYAKGEDGLSIEADEGWGMITKPEFGCIHWIKKQIEEGNR